MTGYMTIYFTLVFVLAIILKAMDKTIDLPAYLFIGGVVVFLAWYFISKWTDKRKKWKSEKPPTWYICPNNRDHYCSTTRRTYCPVCSTLLVNL